MSTFVFFHVGDDIALPSQLVASLASHHPGAEIIQVTDSVTPTVPGVTHTVVTSGDRQHLMAWRTRAFYDLGLDEPAAYLDTDMVCRRPFAPAMLLADYPAVFCKRSFMRDAAFTGRQRGQDFSEYAGRPLGELYPYVGCFVVTEDADVWGELSEMFTALPDKFRVWYGDQEVLREFADRHSIATVAESQYACLPEHLPEYPHAVLVHYKGPRKLNGRALA